MSRPSPSPSRPARPLEGAAADARAALPAAEAARFDRLASAVLASSALGPALRGLLPGTAGIRWLHREGIAPTARPAVLTSEQWLSLHRSWHGSGRAPSAPAPRSGGRPSRDGHGHAPGALAAPRWF